MPGVIAEGQPKARKPTKNQQRRSKKKQQKSESSIAPSAETPESALVLAPEPDPEDGSESTYSESYDINLDAKDPIFGEYASVLKRFQEQNVDETVVEEQEKPAVFYDDNDNIAAEDEDDHDEDKPKPKMSKKARKAAKKLSIAELKALVRKPEIVEWTDPSAEDPKLLVSIKSTKNVVPVPSHWSLKREYLSSKRGIEKPGFALPKFIAETGIGEMRDAVLEKQAEASLKQKQRERVQPKMGKLDIDYQKLYEAFFRRQTKPELTKYGEVYYEGKEHETKLHHLRPGELSEELKEALNMPPGAPPPWLINQQKIGPPPSYPAMKIAGLNAPPPPGGQWGFHPGGFGKPPVDDQNNPLWGGDLFGVNATEDEKDESRVVAVDRTLWGELQPIEEEEEEEQEDEDDEESDDEDDEAAQGDARAVGMQTPSGLETPGGFVSSVPTDFTTHTMAREVDLRKPRRGTETEDSQYPRSAGQVLQERAIRAEGFFGGERAYDLGKQRAAPANTPMLGEQDERGQKRKVGDVDVAINVDALEREGRMSKDQVRKQYDLQRQQQGSSGFRGIVDQEDLSQMIAEESAKRQKRDQAGPYRR